MMEFPHKPPQGYTYETTEFKRNVVAIWIRNHRKFDYNGADSVRSIWGFYDTKKRCYYAPVNSSKQGNTVAIENTTPYTAMPLLKVAQSMLQEAPVPSIIDSTPQESMTATFAQFASEQTARNTIHLNIVKYCLMLCDALTADANHLKAANYGFELDSSGRKYHKIFMCINGKRDSIHAFIDKKTGEVYKPASTKQPAKGVRYNMLSITSREEMFERCDWAGGYLYMR